MHFLVVANCCVPGYGYNTRYPVCTDVIRVTQNDFVISPISWDSSDANCTTSLEVSATIIYLNQHHFTLVFGKYLCIRCMYHSRKISLFTNSLYGTADAALTKIKLPALTKSKSQLFISHCIYIHVSGDISHCFIQYFPFLMAAMMVKQNVTTSTRKSYDKLYRVVSKNKKENHYKVAAHTPELLISRWSFMWWNMWNSTLLNNNEMAIIVISCFHWWQRGIFEKDTQIVLRVFKLVISSSLNYGCIDKLWFSYPDSGVTTTPICRRSALPSIFQAVGEEINIHMESITTTGQFEINLSGNAYSMLLPKTFFWMTLYHTRRSMRFNIQYLDSLLSNYVIVIGYFIIASSPSVFSSRSLIVGCLFADNNCLH